MIPILSLLLVIGVSVLVTRVASIALVHTGLSRETARFQARSAFTGCGFTTSESEKLVNHPVRRRILLLLMLLGNAGIVTAVSTLILGFVGQEPGLDLRWRVALLGIGVVALFVFASSRWVDRHLGRLVSWALERFTRLHVVDYASLLHMAGEYGVSELAVEPGDWTVGKSLEEADLFHEGLLVLGITRTDGTYIGAPRGETRFEVGDGLVIYGRLSALERLDERAHGRRGDHEHAEAVREQRACEERERAEDPVADSVRDAAAAAAAAKCRPT